MINVYIRKKKLKIFGTGASFVVTSPRDAVHQRKCPATTRRPCVVHPSSPLHIRHVFVRQRASSAPPFLYRRSCPTEHTNTIMPATPGCQTQAYTCKTRSSQTILTYTNKKRRRTGATFIPHRPADGDNHDL